MVKTKIEIKSRWLGSKVLFEYEVEDNSIKKTLEHARAQKAYLNGANLIGTNLIRANLNGADLNGAYLNGADLNGADLNGANLNGAYLNGADLNGADLNGANLNGANLIRADLNGADLNGAYLNGANLIGTNLIRANLNGADLNGAYLNGANLNGADLNGANLIGANLNGAKNIPQSYINVCSRDMLFIFRALKHELLFLREKLIAGEVDGSQYEGACACLIGTLAKAEGQSISKVCKGIPFYEKGMHNLGEQWFWQIRVGDTPKTNFFAKHALKLIDLVLKEEA
jgi:uncharacterized protein YjbI with pentapeptide repeats